VPQPVSFTNEPLLTIDGVRVATSAVESLWERLRGGAQRLA